MKAYQSNKVVHAKPMTSTRWKEFRKKLTRYSDASLDDNLDGYVVVYNPMAPNEYWSWSPKEEFEEGYSEIHSKKTKFKTVTKFA